MTAEEIKIRRDVRTEAIMILRSFVLSRSEGRAWSPAEVTSWLQTLDDLRRHVELWVIEEQEKENG